MTDKKHELVIRDFKTSLGFVAKCKCGAKIYRMEKCNGAGRRYGLVAAQQEFERHIAKRKKQNDG